MKGSQFSHSVMSISLRPHESHHARPPSPLPTPGVHSNSLPSSPWCHPAISSSVVPSSSCPQSLPASASTKIMLVKKKKSRILIGYKWTLIIHGPNQYDKSSLSFSKCRLHCSLVLTASLWLCQLSVIYFFKRSPWTHGRVFNYWFTQLSFLKNINILYCC